MKDFIFKLFYDTVCVNLMLHSFFPMLLDIHVDLIAATITEKSVFCLIVTDVPVSFQCFLNKTLIKFADCFLH